jgi:hypothetical protein
MQSLGVIQRVPGLADTTGAVSRITQIIEQQMERVENVHATEWYYIHIRTCFYSRVICAPRGYLALSAYVSLEGTCEVD